MEAGNGAAVVTDGQDICLGKFAARLREDVQQAVVLNVRRPHAQGGGAGRVGLELDVGAAREDEGGRRVVLCETMLKCMRSILSRFWACN